MIILGLDSSAVNASCAVVDNAAETVLAYGSVNVPVVHSQTLLPLVESILKAADLSLNGVDAFAVSCGPGSFTGLRISASAVKGMALALNKPICGVSTLLSLAYNLIGRDVIACCVMDARRGEVYNALFDVCGADITRVTPDRAVSLTDLGEELSQLTEKEIVFVGDGAGLAHDYFGGTCSIAAEIIRYQNAASVCFATKGLEFAPAGELIPRYIRKPQAQREYEEGLK